MPTNRLRKSRNRMEETLAACWKHYFMYGEAGLWDDGGPVDQETDKHELFELFTLTSNRPDARPEPEVIKRYMRHRLEILKAWRATGAEGPPFGEQFYIYLTRASK